MVAASVETRLAAAWNALGDVNDPEIPTVSVVDLGVVRTVAFSSDGRALEIELMPTFVGCPAVDVMRDEITAKLSALGIADEVRVALSFVEAWTSERITARGRERLRRSGFAPPVPQGRIPP
ncbi:MAG: metal-sulfur cluster assembly factor, partial [Candidatus Limnocylindria bacterium]